MLPDVNSAQVRQRTAVIIGGGPAGLTAALYLARFGVDVGVFDDGRSRAKLIPTSHNLPAFPAGLSGNELLFRMKAQALEAGAAMIDETVTALVPRAGGFTIGGEHTSVMASMVLLACGVVNHRPSMPDDMHDEAVRRGLLRYCPICDGAEVRDKRIAVIGSGAHGIREAQFLRSYSSDVSLVSPDGRHDFSRDEDDEARRWNIQMISGPCAGYRLARDGIRLAMPRGWMEFDTAYSALGTCIRSQRAVDAGAGVSAQGCIRVDEHQRTNVRGLYAAGDVTEGLDQIARAMGQAAVAATAMRNDWCKHNPLKRESM